jgi:hypothetical protein
VLPVLHTDERYGLHTTTPRLARLSASYYGWGASIFGYRGPYFPGRLTAACDQAGMAGVADVFKEGDATVTLVFKTFNCQQCGMECAPSRRETKRS